MCIRCTGEVVLAWTDDVTDPQHALSKADYDYLSGKPTRKVEN